MIRLLIKLALAALIANAAWRVGSVYASFYKFKDAVQETTQYGADKSETDLRARIVDLGAQYDLPITDDNFSLRRVGDHTITDGSFTRPIEVLPNYRYSWPFTWHTDTFALKSGLAPAR
jgi:hypothetical protein